MLKWIGNIIDPKYQYSEQSEEEREEKASRLHGKHIGEPKGNDTYTVEQFKQMNMVGVYTEE